MSLHFYCNGEDNEKEESIDKYMDIFTDFLDNPPSLKEALIQVFIAGGVPEIELNDYVEDLNKKVYKVVEDEEIKIKIKEKYPNISKDDSLIIASYTCEAKNKEFSPYRTLNRNLASDNREEGLKKVSKYLFILLKALRKLKRYYPAEEQKYLYRGIKVMVNTKIDPFNPKLVPYLRNNRKTFWAFSSTSPLTSTAFGVLSDNGYHEEKKLKSGTFFSLYGKIWGYDITIFNRYNEEEILLEPERKFKIEKVIPDPNGIIYITCEILDSPIVLNDLKKRKINCNSNFNNNSYYIQNQMPIQLQMSRLELAYLKEKEKIYNILFCIFSQFEAYSFKYENVKTENLFSLYYKLDQNISKSGFFIILEDNINSFKKKYIEFIEEYGKLDFPNNFSLEKAIKYLNFLSKCIKENKVKAMISTFISIIKI